MGERSVISRIELNNFQSHADSALDLSPGVNVVVGTSNAGKTAIVRALEWVRRNRPAGTSIIKLGSVGGAAVAVALDTGIIVRRVRSKRQNKYEVLLEGKILELEAVGQAVPEEVSKALNIADINVQSQLEPHFMVLDSPGSIAERFSRILSLDKAEEVSSALSSRIRGANQDIVGTRGHLDRVRATLADARWCKLERFESLLAEVKGGLERLVETKRMLELLRSIQGRYASLANKLAVVESVLAESVDRKESLARMMKAAEALEEMRAKHGRLLHIQSKLVEIQKALDVLWPADVVEKHRDDLVVIRQKDSQRKRSRLKQLLVDIGDVHFKLANNKKLGSELSAERQSVCEDLTICPVCEREFVNGDERAVAVSNLLGGEK